MLEFLRRHHKTLWIVVTIVVIIAFTFFGSFTKTGSRAGHTSDDTAIEILNREYSYAEIGRLQRHYRVAAGLMLPGTERYYASDLVNIVSQFRKQEDGRPLEMMGAPLDFAVNLLVLREELEKNGIRASDAEVKERFKQLQVFQTEGQFNSEKAEAFESNLGSFGMNVNDVYELLRDWIGYQRLQQLVSGNVVATPEMTNQYYSATRQTIKVSSIPFALESFKKDAQVSDDEIKKYFEEKKEGYKTPQQRAVNYVFIEAPKDVDKLSADERMKKNNEFGKKVQDFAIESIVEGVNFDELAKKFAVEVRKTPAFSFSEIPDDLKNQMELVFTIFRNDPKTHPISDPLQTKEGCYFFTVTEIKEPQQQELKDVQEKVKEELVTKKAREGMVKAANDARKKLSEAIKSGKDFAGAVKEAGLEAQALPEFSPMEPLKDIGNGDKIAGEAQKTPAGSFTKPITTENGMLLVFVQSKELRKSPESATAKEGITQSLGQFSQNEVFRAWFGKRRDEAKVKPHFKI